MWYETSDVAPLVAKLEALGWTLDDLYPCGWIFMGETHRAPNFTRHIALATRVYGCPGDDDRYLCDEHGPMSGHMYLRDLPYASDLRRILGLPTGKSGF